MSRGKNYNPVLQVDGRRILKCMHISPAAGSAQTLPLQHPLAGLPEVRKTSLLILQPFQETFDVSIDVLVQSLPYILISKLCVHTSAGRYAVSESAT